MTTPDLHNEDTLKEVYAELTAGLEAIVSYASDLFTSDDDSGANKIIDTLSESIEQLGFFESFAFYKLVDQIDFKFMTCSSAGNISEFDKDIDGHIDHGTFAWALKNAKTVLVTGPCSNKDQVLFAVATRRRIHGMFIGNAKPGESISGYMQNFLRLLITLAAQSIDNIELTSQIKKHNLELEQKIEERTKELDIARQKAEDSARSKSAFLANMSHEIRTPMNGVLGMLELLNKSGLDKKQKQYVGNAQRSGNNLLVILNDILDLSKVEAGKINLEKIDFDLRDMINDVVELFAPRTQEKSLEIAACFDESLPDFINADRTRLWQIISNLVGNAVKFTTTGHIAIYVSSKVMADSDELEIRFNIHDTGIGLDADVQKKIFDPFEQADDSTTRHFGGTGLGLALCKRLCDLMDGVIGLDSVPGEGSTFWFTIPVLPAAKQTGQQRHAIDLPDTVAGLRILVVDDLVYSRKSIKELLSRHKLDVTTADSAASAQQLLEQSLTEHKPYDLLLVDEVMPGIGGNEFLAKLSKDDRYKDIKAWLMSVQAQTIEDQNSLSADIEGIIQKPLLPLNLPDIFQGSFGDSSELPNTVSQEDERPQFCGEILLVEDNVVNQMVAEGLLNIFGVNITIAENGAEALDTLEEKEFDLVFMDVQMPIMNGLDATRKIRQGENEHEHIPIVALTASVLKEDIQECYNSGMDDFLAKPFDSDGLVGILQKWLASAEDSAASV